MLKRLLLSISLSLSPIISSAQTLDNPITDPDLDTFLNAIIDVIIQLGVIVLVVMLIISGYLFVSAQGNEEQLEKAKRAFVWTIIGGGILIGAGAIKFIVVDTMSLVLP